jgi:dTDP-glucose 4,6-dehydratase
MQKNLQALTRIYKDCEDVLSNRVHNLNDLRNKTLYIAGGLGFVGTWVATLLTYLNEHHDFNTQIYLLARHPEILNHTAGHLAKNKQVTLVSNDVRKIFELPSHTNYVLHAACNPDSRFHALNPLETMSVIVDGTKNLLSAAERCSHLEKFLYLSSASIYGSQPFDLKNIKENFFGSAPKPDSAQSAYAEAKRFAETLCTVFRSQFRLPVAIARPFTLVGPYQALDRPWAINNFINDVIQNERIRVLGDGKTVRTYLYGSDVAFWLLTMLVKANVGQVYNLGSDQEVDVKRLAEMVAECSSTKPEVVFSNVSLPTMQASRLVPSIELAKDKLDLSVTVSLQNSIKRTFDWNQQC